MDSFTIHTTGLDYSGHATVGNTSYCFVSHEPVNTLPTEHSFQNTYTFATINGTTLDVFHDRANAHVYLNSQLVHQTKHSGHYILHFQPYDTVRVVCGFLDIPTHDGTAKELCQRANHTQDISFAILLHSPVICIPYSLSSFSSDHVRNTFPFDIYKVDEVCYHDRKLFFLHFHFVSDDLRLLLQNIHLKPVKLYYHDNWFWHLTLRSSCLEHDYLSNNMPLDDYIPSLSLIKIYTFIANFLSC